MPPPAFRTYRAPLPATATKSPAEVEDYGFDWSGLLAAGEQVASAEWEQDGGVAGTLVLRDAAVEGAVSYVWAEGGSDGSFYQLTGTARTSAGRAFQARLLLCVRGG